MTIISRSEWGARPPRTVSSIVAKTGGVVIHYTASDSSGVTAHWPQCYDRWRGHQNYHMDNKGWNDLAYNFGVCIHGFIFEGRGWDARNGANTPENTSTLSICIDVDANDTFDEAVVVNVNKLIAEAVERGWARKLRGHYQVSTSGTPCPGATIKALMDEGKIHLPGETEAGPSEPPPTEGVPLLAIPTILEMQDWARNKNATPLFVDLAVDAFVESTKLGVNPKVVYAIMAHETGLGHFGGVLDVSFKNWGGMKKPLGGGNFDPSAHQRFTSHRHGVRAVAQHVAWYAGMRLPLEGRVDPRYDAAPQSRIVTLPDDDWGWASTEHDSNVVRYVQEM